MRVGVKVTPSIGSNIVARRASAARRRADRALRVRGILADPAQERLRLGGEPIGGLARGEPVEHRPHLQQGVFAHRRHRRVPGHPVGDDA